MRVLESIQEKSSSDQSECSIPNLIRSDNHGHIWIVPVCSDGKDDHGAMKPRRRLSLCSATDNSGFDCTPSSIYSKSSCTMVIGGGGSNILRGGKRSYDCTTLVGNFVEESFRPNAVTQHWDGGAKYETNTRDQMLNGVSIKRHEFGGGLKRPDDPKYDYHQIVSADKTRGASTWISLAQSTLNNSATPTEFAAPREMKGRRMPEDELDKHRKRWTNECDELVKARYVTESSATQDACVNERFRKVLTRPTQVSYK